MSKRIREWSQSVLFRFYTASHLCWNRGWSSEVHWYNNCPVFYSVALLLEVTHLCNYKKPCSCLVIAPREGMSFMLQAWPSYRHTLWEISTMKLPSWEMLNDFIAFDIFHLHHRLWKPHIFHFFPHKQTFLEAFPAYCPLNCLEKLSFAIHPCKSDQSDQSART